MSAFLLIHIVNAFILFYSQIKGTREEKERSGPAREFHSHLKTNSLIQKKINLTVNLRKHCSAVLNVIASVERSVRVCSLVCPPVCGFVSEQRMLLSVGLLLSSKVNVHRIKMKTWSVSMPVSASPSYYHWENLVYNAKEIPNPAKAEHERARGEDLHIPRRRDRRLDTDCAVITLKQHTNNNHHNNTST